MSNNLHQRITLFSDLDCQVARHFSGRPALLEVAADLLEEQWQARGLGAAHASATLYLASRQQAPGKVWVRPLAQVLVERYCLRHTLNLTPGEDFLTPRLDPDPVWQVSLDLHEVELLINDVAPHLLVIYQQRLVAYWSRFDGDGQTPWSWYAAYLRRQLHDAIAAHGTQGNLPAFALAAARLVHDYPAPDQRNAWPNTAGLEVSALSVDFSADDRLDADLASAVLIEHDDPEPTRKFALLHTLTGKLLGFTSRQALLAEMARCWPGDTPASPRLVSITPSAQTLFDNQAIGLLSQQLRVMEHLAGRYRNRLDAIDLSLDLDRLTSLIDLCSSAETRQRQPLAARLPDWLRNAPSKPLLHYSTLLIDVAQGYKDVQGQFWLDGIDNAEDFANQLLTARFAADYPDDPLKPRQVRVFNYQTTAGAAAGQDAVVTSGEVLCVEFSLAQLAIGNLGLLKPGRVELRSVSGQPLPAWMNEAYLRTLVSELDIASAYPSMLRRKLLGAPGQRAQRQHLLNAQLRTQLPALAMELYLRGTVPDPNASKYIAQVFADTCAEGAQPWVLRPLGFIKAPGSAPDHPRNTWLIEADQPGAGPCLLYRPLHEDSLLYFSDRLALFVAISTAGELQEDLLQRLPAEDRRFYAHGGFLEPHLFVPLDDTSAIPSSTPAPVTLAAEPAAEDPGAALYLACVHESIERFEAHASTTAQARWASWKQLGWLLFNTLLPLAGGTLGKVAWLAQMEVALAEYVESDPLRNPEEHQLAMVNLLVNISMLLFSHSIFRLRLERSEVPDLEIAPNAPLPKPLAPASPPEVVSAPFSQLDFGWARPDHRLTVEQRKALDALGAPLSVATLGSPIPAGPLKGLHLHGSSLYTVLDGKAFAVERDLALDRMRIIGPDATLGPWLRIDELGRWQLDLRLQLKGGMPLSAQIRKLRLEKADAFDAANALILADKALIAGKLKEMTTLESLVSVATEDAALALCQGKIQAVSEFWTTHLEHLSNRNSLQPVKDFKTVHAYALYQDSFCQRLLHKVLHKRYQPNREQLLQIARQPPDTVTPTDVQIVTQRLDLLAPLLELMLQNNRRLRQRQAELDRLASQQHPDIVQWRDLAASVPATLEKDWILQFLQLEGRLNRLTLVDGLSEGAAYWRDRFWDNFQLGVTQRARLFKLEAPGEEVQARLLGSIQDHFLAARRQLGNLAELVTDDSARQTLRLMEDQADGILEGVARDLAELPDYPPTNTLGQLRSKVPGLIETTEHGLLLAERREDDANTVDIPGPDNKSPGRTYHLKHGNWVEVKTASTARPPARQKLKRLLKDSASLMASARDEVAKLQRAGDNYLPVEIEESVLHQRERLLAQAEGIEGRLTADNQTDEARRGLDAENVASALRSLAETLQATATQLRIRAALAQKPRMGEVQFLLEKGQVRIGAVGSRTQLAKQKGRPADFLDEYAIEHQGQVLWYAHFHYPAMDSAKADFTAGHLKLAAQRHVAGQRYTSGNGLTVDVHRAPITASAARQYFFTL